MSVWVVLDLLDHFTNTRVLSFVSQHNMAIQVFGNQCSPRSALIARYLARDLRHGRQRVAPFYHDLFRLQRWSLCFHQMNVFGNSWLVICVTADNGLLRSILCWFIFNVEAHQMNVFGNSWLVICVTADNGLLRSITFNSFFMKRTCFDLLGTGTFLFHLARSLGRPRQRVAHFLSWSGFGFDWFNCELVNCCTTCPSGRWAAFGPNSFIQSCFKEILGGGRGDANTFSYMTSPVFHPNNFRNTISRECFVNNDSFRSSLIELQSFLQSNIDVYPKTVLWCFFHALCMCCAWRVEYKSIVPGSLWFLSMGSTGRKNTVCLLLKFLTSRYQSRIDDGM